MRRERKHVASAGITNVHDFENHLIQHGGITYQYDGDGNRVSKTIGGVKTTYLVDDQASPTGYAQVVEETQNGVLQGAFVYGPMRASGALLRGRRARLGALPHG